MEPQLHTLKGELLLLCHSPDAAEAENCFRTAIQIANRQKARFFELHATISLARLLATQGRRDEARRMLSEIYNWFTEGFDTRDLQEAKQLLNELAQES
jgi:predicted ATPase